MLQVVSFAWDLPKPALKVDVKQDLWCLDLGMRRNGQGVSFCGLNLSECCFSDCRHMLDSRGTSGVLVCGTGHAQEWPMREP